MDTAPKILFFDSLENISYQRACGSGLGGSLFKLAAFEQASSNGYEVHLLTSPKKKELLEDAFGIDSVYTDLKNLNLSKFSKVINMGLAVKTVSEELTSHSGYCSFNESDFKNYKTSPHISFWRQFTAHHLNYSPDDSAPELELCLESENILEVFKAVPKNQKWLALSYQVVSPLKDYPFWDMVINGLLMSDPELHIVLLGDKEIKKEFPGRVVNLMGKTDIQMLKAYISQAHLVLGVDGLATNLAIAFDRPSVILFSMISPKSIIIDSIDQTKIATMTAGDCPYQFCYADLENYRNSGCRFLEENPDQNMPECLSFDPNKIVEEVCSLLN